MLRSVSRRLAGALLPVLLLCAGCGTSPGARAGTTVGSPPAGSPPATGSSSVPGAGKGSPRPPTSSGASGVSPRGRTRGTPTGGATQVRLPARFVIRAGGSLDPSSVSSPALVPIELTVRSGDGRAHSLVLHTPAAHTLAVAAHGGSSALIPGLRAGRYVIAIDGAARGALLIGGQPGP